MNVKVRIPIQLQKLTDGVSEVEVTAATVAGVIANLDQTYPGVAARLLDDTGAVRRFINLYVGEEDIRFLDGLTTALADGDQLVIIPSVAGGT